MSFTVLAEFAAHIYGKIHWTVDFLPVIFIAVVLVTAGVGWLFAVTGVYIRNHTYVTGLLSSMLIFLSPIFLLAEQSGARIPRMILANPLTFIIEHARVVLVNGAIPDLLGVARYIVGSIIFRWLCLAWFQKAREGFTDVHKPLAKPVELFCPWSFRGHDRSIASSQDTGP